MRVSTARDEEQSAQWSDRTHEPESRGVKGEGVYAAAEQGHACGKKGCRQRVIARDEESDRVDELRDISLGL